MSNREQVSSKIASIREALLARKAQEEAIADMVAVEDHKQMTDQYLARLDVMGESAYPVIPLIFGHTDTCRVMYTLEFPKRPSALVSALLDVEYRTVRFNKGVK